MRSRFSADLALLLLIAALGTFLQHRQTLEYGFDYDDYHFVRPYSWSEIRAAFHGPWDATGIETGYFRPLTIAFYAARFSVFGLNSAGYHAASLGMFALAAILVGLFARSIAGRPAAGFIAAITFIVHPSMPYAATAWITNQMHLIELLVVLAGLLWWFAIRRRGAAWWWPLLVIAIAAVTIKEDGIMLLPSVLVLHWLRRRLVEPDLPRAPIPFVLVSASALAGLLAYRQSVLHGLGGDRVLTVDGAWTNLRRGFDGVFRLLPARRPWQLTASWFVTVLPLVAVACWGRARKELRFALLAGLAIGVLFELPFVFVIKAEQLHLVATGAALLLAAAAIILLEAAPGFLLRALVICALAFGTVALSRLSNHIEQDFKPFGAIVLGRDALSEWAAVPLELRDYLKAKRIPGAEARLSPNPADALDFVAFGLHGVEHDAAGTPVRWMSGARTELYINARAHHVTIPLRHEIGVFRESTLVAITADGRHVDTLELNDGSWKVSRLALLPSDVDRLSRMHRVTIEIPRAWTPAIIFPGSADTRTLGLQVGKLQIW